MSFEKWIPRCFEGLEDVCLHADCLETRCVNCEFGVELNPVIDDRDYEDRYEEEYQKSYLAGEVI